MSLLFIITPSGKIKARMQQFENGEFRSEKSLQENDAFIYFLIIIIIDQTMTSGISLGSLHLIILLISTFTINL